MTTRLIRARTKPRFGLPWLAMLLGLASGGFAVQGIQTVTATPSAQLEIVVEGVHPLNISQETVTAALGGPVATWRPIRVLVTDQLLNFDEKAGRINPGADVILTTALDRANSSQERHFTGAGVYPPDATAGVGFGRAPDDIAGVYMDNVGLGHGPKAVAAAALRAVDLLDEDPGARSPLFWLAGTAAGLVLTVGTLTFSLSRRRRRERLYQRLTAAQRRLAGVVLELEALEVTYRSTPEKRRTAGYTATWTRIRDASLTLARSEDAAMEAVYSAGTALKPHTAKLVTAFEIGTQQLTAHADALMGAGSVLGKLAGSQGVLDRLAAPVAFAGHELLARLDTRPAGTVTARRVLRFRNALNALLTAAAGGRQSSTSLQAWTKAEDEVQATAQAIDRSLRHGHALPPGEAQRGDLSALRVGLGLSGTGSERVLSTLDHANAAAHARFGPLPGSDEGVLALPEFPWYELFLILLRPSARTAWIMASSAALIVSVIVSGVMVTQSPHAPSWDLYGTQPLRSLSFDGDLGSLDQDKIRRSVPDKFTHAVDVTVAVRSAENYFPWPPGQPDPNTSNRNFQDRQSFVDGLWRLKAEFPELVDPATGELREDQAIVPLWRVGPGLFTVPTFVSGAVSHGDDRRFGIISWTMASFDVTENEESEVAYAIKALSRGLQSNAYVKPEIDSFWHFVLLTLSLFLSIATVALVISYGSAVSMKIGRFGRNAKTLRRARRELDALALGLDDSRINAVAVLGSSLGSSRGSSAGIFRTSSTIAESDQRIYERALAVAWRMADDLASRPLSRRLDAGYVAEIERLTAIVATLGLRDSDVQRRTRLLLDTALVRGPAT